ncbi:MAG: hypothetical protein AAGC71_06780 [Pseudomonadota bacterium]
MFENFVQSVRGLVARLSGTDQSRSEAVRASSVQRVMRRPSTNGKAAPATTNGSSHGAADAYTRQPESAESEQADADVATPRRVISRGNNKNVYVIATPELDENEALRQADELVLDTGSLETIDEDGFDPYNSGSYRRRER